SEWVHQYVTTCSDYRFTVLQVVTDQYRRQTFEEAVYQLPDQVTSFIRIAPPGLQSGWKEGLEQWYRNTRKQLDRAVQHSDIVHVANTGFAGWIGMRLARTYHKPLVLTEHALYWKEVLTGAAALECGYKISVNKEQKHHTVQMFRGIARKIYRAADTIISVSECNISEQRELGAEKVHYIPNGVERSWLKTQKKRGEKLTLGWIGRCAEMKNPLRFLDLVQRMDPTADALMMLCDAGEDALKQKVITKSKHCSSLKMIWNRPAAENIDQMDALCITSHNESQPLVLFEALARRVLPFGWRVGDVTDKYARVVARDSGIDELAALIEQTWRDPELWRQEVEKRVERVAADHTWQSIFERYRSIMQQTDRTNRVVQ
ncbi:MAG: DUF3492 domain-containing protein, partial [Balneolaceae bacterium]|nr:DUF3492 domain-containing protein [Balneolaceae bacterium]